METITIHHDAEGKVDGVRVNIPEFDFVIALNDSFNGEEVTYQETKRLALPSYGIVQQVSFWHLDINRMLEQAGGTKLEGWYWTDMNASDLFGDGNGKVVIEGQNGYINRNYDFFLCTAKAREMWLLEKEEKDEE